MYYEKQGFLYEISVDRNSSFSIFIPLSEHSMVVVAKLLKSGALLRFLTNYKNALRNFQFMVLPIMALTCNEVDHNL